MNCKYMRLRPRGIKPRGRMLSDLDLGTLCARARLITAAPARKRHNAPARIHSANARAPA